MSPFRSESEHLKEQLRRAEEKILELGEEKADLQRQIDIGRRSRGWIAASACAMALSGGLGFLVATVDAQKKRVGYEHEMRIKINDARQNEVQCLEAHKKTKEELLACTERFKPQGTYEPRETSRYVPGPSDRECLPGDPLCSYLDRAFNRGAAAAALGAVDVKSCKTTDTPAGDGHITVTFAPTGHVESAVIDTGPLAGTPGGGCVAAKYRSAKVPPFDGAPVRVGKSFSLD